MTLFRALRVEMTAFFCARALPYSGYNRTVRSAKLHMQNSPMGNVIAAETCMAFCSGRSLSNRCVTQSGESCIPVELVPPAAAIKRRRYEGNGAILESFNFM